MTDQPHRLGDALERVARDIGIADPKAMATVMTNWPSLVGATVADHAVPRHLRDGVLVVHVDDGAWAAQLRYLEADIVAGLDAVGVDVARVRMRVEPRR